MPIKKETRKEVHGLVEKFLDLYEEAIEVAAQLAPPPPAAPSAAPIQGAPAIETSTREPELVEEEEKKTTSSGFVERMKATQR